MAGTGYQNFADDSGIESEFEAGLDEVNTSIKSTSELQDESGQSGRYNYFLWIFLWIFLSDKVGSLYK